MSGKGKKIIALLLTVLTVLSFGTLLCAAEDGLTAFSAEAFGNEKCTVNWWRSDLDGKYYMFMPSDCDLSSLKISFDGAAKITVGNTQISDGQLTDVFKDCTEYKITCGKTKYTVVFMQSKNIPSVYIETETGSLDTIHKSKNNKEKAEITVVADGDTVIDNAELKYIKGRGNSTWAMYSKKPYNIKFEKKTDLLGMGSAKKWSLIASAAEESLIRNKGVYDLAEDVGLYYSSHSTHVDLYINNDYMGNYLICESVEVGSNRVDITDLEDLNEKANDSIDIESCALMGTRGFIAGYTPDSRKWVDIPNDPDDITGGYLLELEQMNRYSGEVSGFVTKIGQPVTMKSPEYISKAQIDYISSYYQQFEDAVYSENGVNDLGKHYTDYMDMQSMARMYIIQELAMNLDASRTSFYLYKDAGSDKFVASPVWDFDFSLGKKAKRNGIDLTNPELWYARVGFIYDDRSIFEAENDSFFTLLAELCKHDDFIAEVKKEWKNVFLPQLGEKRTTVLTQLRDKISASAVLDAIRWNRYETNDYSKNLSEYKKQADYVIDFLTVRTKALDKGFSDKAAVVRYDGNGAASGIVINDTINVIGETAVAKDNAYESGKFKYYFKQWNTEPDGSGISYMPGDEIPLEKEETVLYAQWKEVTFFEALAAKFFTMFMNFLSIIMQVFKLA